MLMLDRFQTNFELLCCFKST